MTNLKKTPQNGRGGTIYLESDMLSRKRILREMELMDWSGHVELPISDLEWLASQLYVRLTESKEEICEACGRPNPLVITTVLGPICAECVEDMNDHIDQMRDAVEDS